MGVYVGSIALKWLAHPSVNYVVTLPGRYGSRWAFFAEIASTFLLMSVILRVSNTPKLNRYTGLFAAFLVMTYISVEAPLSGMSMNPARTLGSALSAANWTAIWIYFTAPPLGMLIAAELYVRSAGTAAVLCAKLHHDNPRALHISMQLSGLKNWITGGDLSSGEMFPAGSTPSPAKSLVRVWNR